MNDFRTIDPSVQRFFTSSHAYVVFPRIITAAVGVGGAHGDGEVYENGKFAGYADVSQGSIGVQLGGQKYAEILFFQNEGSFVDFKYSGLEFDARATAIAAANGAAATADYRAGLSPLRCPNPASWLKPPSVGKSSVTPLSVHPLTDAGEWSVVSGPSGEQFRVSGFEFQDDA